MAGYVIHLAIAKMYAEKNNIKNTDEFFKGAIMPDLLDKTTSHYGEFTSTPDLSLFLKENSLDSDYNKGYFLHLVTDYLFYNKYLDSFSEEIYHDYNKLNDFLIQKFNIDIPSEIKQVVGTEEGEPQIIDKEGICNFIEAVASLDITKIGEQEKLLEDDEDER